MHPIGRWLSLAPIVGFGCSNAHSFEIEHDSREPYAALVLSSDYSSTAVAAIDLKGDGRLTSTVDLGRDPELTTSHGRFFIIARDLDKIYEFDPLKFRVTSTLNVHDPASFGSSNPYDIAIASDGMQWVVLYNSPTIAIFDSAGVRRDTIDISAYDRDGNPNASAIETIGDTAFVALQRVDDEDRLRSKQPSYVLRINTVTHKVESHIELLGRNPFPQMVTHGSSLYVFEPGDFDRQNESHAGIERIDTETNATTLLATKAELGGSPISLAIMGGCLAAVVADTAPDRNATSLVTLNLESTTIPMAPPFHAFGPTAGFDLRGLAWMNGETLMLGDRRSVTGRGYPLHIFDRTSSPLGAKDCALHLRERDIFVSHPPVSLQSTLQH